MFLNAFKDAGWRGMVLHRFRFSSLSRSIGLPSRMSPEMRRAFQMFCVGLPSTIENVRAAARGDQAKLVPAELQAVVIGGGGQGLPRAEAQPDQQLQFGVHPDARQRAVDRRAGGCQVMRIGGKERLVDPPETQRRLLGLLALGPLPGSAGPWRAGGASKARAGNQSRPWRGWPAQRRAPGPAARRPAPSTDCDDPARAGKRC